MPKLYIGCLSHNWKEENDMMYTLNDKIKANSKYGATGTSIFYFHNQDIMEQIEYVAKNIQKQIQQ